MNTNHSTRPAPSASSPNPAPAMNAHPNPSAAGAAPHAYGVHTEAPLALPPMPIYLGAQNTPTTEAEQAPLETEGGRPLPGRTGTGTGTPAYNPTELAKALLALLGILLGLTLALGGWQPHTSEARLGWSHGDIVVKTGTDGDTGSRPLDPADEGVRPAPNPPVDTVYAGQGYRPVDLPHTYVGDGSRFAPGISPWAGPVDA